MVRVKLPTYVDEKSLSDLKENFCGNFFEKYFGNQTKEKPVVLQQGITKPIKKIVNTMKRWCSDTNEMSHLKDLVIYSFDLLVYFDKWFHKK